MARIALLVLPIAALLTAPAAAQIPDISGIWTRGPAVQAYFRPPPGGGLGPILNLTPPPPDAGGGFGGGYVADISNPMLQPWTAAVLKEHGDAEKAGKPFLSAQQRCFPHGVPYVLQLNDFVQFLQNKDQVVILYSREMRARIIRLNAAHFADWKPSYYGDSIGHFEGDTLVVDTAGMNDKTWTDRFGTPHTDKIHVVERYRLVDEGKTLRVDFTVDDVGAFTAPWSATVSYRRGNEYTEQVCAENNRDPFSKQDYPIPTGTAEF